MTRLMGRLAAAADNPLTRVADRLANKFLPTMTASGYCYWRCTSVSCYPGGPGVPGQYRCEYCDGHWTSNCYCTSACL